jgi:nickel-type superoxide dismutase maturation protease
MAPALAPGERVLFDRLAYANDEPRVGDIVLAKHPTRRAIRMVKRVAEGDGLKRDEYWLLGDNSEGSTDSRLLGAFRREDILGRAWIVYWPAGQFRVIGGTSRTSRP